jgi:hypothetical protein
LRDSIFIKGREVTFIIFRVNQRGIHWKALKWGSFCLFT